MDIEKQYRSKVIINGDGECWGWLGSKDRHGYGQVRINHEMESAHRLSWKLHYGAIPEGKCVLHFCDNPECTNPKHLFIGTMKENSKDMIHKGRGGGQFIKGHEGNKTAVCHKGHPKEPGKDCVICHHEADKRYKQRKMALREPRVCPICSKLFRAFGKRLYCSKKCKWKVSNDKRRLAAEKG